MRNIIIVVFSLIIGLLQSNTIFTHAQSDESFSPSVECNCDDNIGGKGYVRNYCHSTEIICHVYEDREETYCCKPK